MTKHKATALVTLMGGPLDGRQELIDSHETLLIDVDDVPYARTDQQLGDARVYRYAPEEGSAPGVEYHDAVVGDNILERDLAELAAAEKKAAKKS